MRTTPGGVAIQSGGTLEVKSSAISGNRAGGRGGAIDIMTSLHEGLRIYDSTVSNNSAHHGGAIGLISWHATPALVVNSTITENKAIGWAAGGIYQEHYAAGGVGASVLQDTVLAGNTAVAALYADVLGKLSGTYNFLGITDGSSWAATGATPDANGNLVGSLAAPKDPMLSPLADHGGPTNTHVPLPASPVIGRGSAAALIDQRGFMRTVGTARDMGATELSAQVLAATDFNGDGRKDDLLFDPVTRSFNIVAGAATRHGKGIEYWGTAPVGALLQK
jgi:hypothetical protein